MFFHNQTYGYVYAPQYAGTVWPDGALKGKSGLIQLSNDYIVKVSVPAGGSSYVNPVFTVGKPWAASTVFGQYQQYVSNGHLYTVTTAGTTGTVAPTATSGSFTDGTCTVSYAGEAAKLSCIPTSGSLINVTITSGGSGYISTPPVTVADSGGGTGSGAVVTVLLNTFPTGPLVPGAVFLDSYVVIGTTAGRLYSSGVNDPTTWNPLDYISAESEPDALVGIGKHLNYVLAFGQWSIDFFYDAANPTGSPLAVAQSYKSEIGCASGNSIVQFEQSIAWIGQSKSTGPSVFMLEGVSPIKVSTPYIERIISNSNLSDVKAYALKYNGHMFYVLTLHDLNTTIVYDVNEKIWYNWTMWAPGDADNGIAGVYAEQYFRPSYFAGTSLVYYTLDDDNGKVYTLSDSAYTDDGAPIYYRAVTDIIDSGTTKRKFYSRIEIIGDKVPAVMSIRHTSDDYNTWSPYKQVNLNASRSQLHVGGASRRRAWEFLCTDAQPIRLDAAEIDFNIGELEQEGIAPAQYRK
jgi:hypothetical protein